jgi:hypothetical protein
MKNPRRKQRDIEANARRSNGRWVEAQSADIHRGVDDGYR